MSDCKACEESRINPWCGAFHALCLECSARALAHSPLHFQAEVDGKVQGEYRKALEAVFGDDWLEGHERVKAWRGKL